MVKKIDLYRFQYQDWREICLEERDTLFEINCSEGWIPMEGRWLMLNMMVCMPLIVRREPVSYKRHMIHNRFYSAAIHANRSTRIRKDLMKAGYEKLDIQRDLMDSIMCAHNMCYTHLGAFIRTIDIFALGDIILHPEFHHLFNIDLTKEKRSGIKKVEDRIKSAAKPVIEMLTSEENKWNVLYAPLTCGVLKKDQFHQAILMVGSRTDTDDYIFPIPMECSYLSGYRGITDLAIESRSGAKAAYYNKAQMPTTQYLNRRIQIMCTDNHKLHAGDCGDTEGIEYLIEEPFKQYYLGKFIVLHDGQLVALDEDNIDEYVGTTQKFRSVGTCRHTDGYCEVCGGELTKNFPSTINVGFAANVESGAKVAQNVLSTKHFLLADAAVYTIPPQLVDYLRVIDNNIMFRRSSELNLEKVAIGFRPRDIARVEDVQLIRDTSSTSPDYFSEIKYLNIGTVEDDGTISSHSSRVSMKGDGDVYPYLSPETLKMITDHPDMVVRDSKLVWIKLAKFKDNEPLFRYTVMNNSIKMFVKAFSNFVTSDIGRYTSISAAIHTLKDFLWKRKIDTHITHIETIARSFVITGALDYSIGEVDHPDDVAFSTLGRIIPRRSIGAQFVYERNREYLASPTASILPKKSGQFDEFFGYLDQCERDRHWPPGCDGSPRDVGDIHVESISNNAGVSR